ncbi:hypothetical protein [Neobacillus niacini]|uniref:hypothetical protein n=1 Tax=Neobacillus niacini TaxID=86668 RepID=UPI0021CB2BC7|nr:hypothetical protein [Neobacillus niacini]MCM3763551.1 hypothetical protein [Neobacillus niacini]
MFLDEMLVRRLNKDQLAAELVSSRDSLSKLKKPELVALFIEKIEEMSTCN